MEADEGTLLLGHGGNTMTLNGVAAALATEQEYPALYRRFAGLVAQGLSEVDLAPLRLVADAFLIGSNRLTNDDVESLARRHPEPRGGRLRRRSG